MIGMPAFENDALLNKEKAEAWFTEIMQRLSSDEVGSQNGIRLEADELETGSWKAHLVQIKHGVGSERLLTKEFFESGEYKAIKILGQQLDGLIGEGSYVQRGDRREEVSSFKQMMLWLMEEAKRGQHIQRYKGLGEMNPEQLWETTLDCNSRCLLQVRIEDVIAADEIFTTLMGDQVEPRRDFIETNALNASNLDV